MQKQFFLYLVVLIVYASACTPKVGVLRGPDYKGDVGATVEKKDTDKGDKDDKTDEGERKTEFAGSNIALVLPFQLNQITPSSIGESDVKRSALALDFYQGFQMGLEESGKRRNVFLNVLDSRDDNIQNASLARSEEIENAHIIVGPVYPKEIRSFGENLVNKNILQINPLAASMPSEFNLPNLVSLTPPIKAHANAIAAEVAHDFRQGDVVIVYNTSDNDGRQFLDGMPNAIRQARSGIQVVSVSSIRQMNENLSKIGSTHVVVGTTDKLQIRTLINNLETQWNEGAYNFKLYGHPLWDRYDWSAIPSFSMFSPKITTESALRVWTSGANRFRDDYVRKYGVQPSDHSYKGYDCAMYFSKLLTKYDPATIKDHLLDEPYQGLYSNYRFTHNDAWGYSNTGVVIRMYGNGGFQIQ